MTRHRGIRIGVSEGTACPVRVLFLASNPSGSAPLELTREVEQLSRRIRASAHGAAYEVIQHWQVQPGEVQGLILRHKPQIVHFSGHGLTSGNLLFQNGARNVGQSRLAAIACMFAILSRYVRCVILNACFTRRQAVAIARSVEVVIGMSDAIADLDALAFSGAFYEALGYGEDVKTAFELARNAIRIERPDSWRHRDVAPVGRRSRPRCPTLPRLLNRRDVDPATIRFSSSG